MRAQMRAVCAAVGLASLLVVSGLVPGRGIVAGPTQADGPDGTVLVYSAKFVCGTAGSTEPLVPGDYATAVNVHNPSNIGKVTIYKKAVEAVAEDVTLATPGERKAVALDPDYAFEIDCSDIRTLLPGSPTGFVKGFVVIYGRQDLDVVAVYTSTRVDSSGVGLDLDVEVVKPSSSTYWPGTNFDAGPFDNGPGVAGDDASVPNADYLDDPVDSDDDNDGLPDTEDINPLGGSGICAAFSGSDDGHSNPAGGDWKNDDDGDKDPAPPMGTDAGDDGASWDTDNDGRLDGAECVLGYDPRDSGDYPTEAECGGSGDTDGDDLPDGWETCGWGTYASDPDGAGGIDPADSDGDGLGDCLEAVDIDGDGTKDFLTDLIPYAKAVLLTTFGKTYDYDLNKDGELDFLTDLISAAKRLLLPDMCP